jgi:CheY-like chemotaxis protein
MAKRALIVDDSRSARVILGRMLEGYGLLVDSSESAEQGLEYLRQSRPDVIFMDHLMPGMDGFQAVQAIKGNPDTATIPVIMYTSQEGDLYLSQARALGAVGVLPKTVKQADVSKVLYQLRLLPERREGRVVAANDDVGPTVEVEAPRRPPQIGELETAVRNAIAPILQEHSSELRRFVTASLDTFARRLASEHHAQQQPAPNVTAEPAVVETSESASSRRWSLVAIIAALALLPTLVLAVLYTRTMESTRGIMQANARLSATVEDQQSQITALRTAASENTSRQAAATPTTATAIRPEPVPYGEVPLAGTRLERLRELIADLKTEGFTGKIHVNSYTGEFCLIGNGFEGYSLASDELPFKRCDVVGNPYDENMTAAQRESVAFANMLSSLRGESSDFISVEVHHLGRKPAIAYPNPNQDKLTAGEWNKAAVANNRVEFVTEPAGQVTE